MNCLTKFFKKKNLGHRLGYEITGQPENSIASLNKALKYQMLDEFKYWEADIVESVDAKVYIFHDATKNKPIDRMCPNSEYSLGKKIYNLHSKEIDVLNLLNTSEKIPTAKEVINELIKYTSKPVNIEIKKITSLKCQIQLTDLMEFANKESINEFYFSMFKSKFRRMNNKDIFLKMCRDKKIRIDFMGF